MYQDLEALANLKLGRAMQEIATQMKGELRKTAVELTRRGMSRSNTEEKAKLRFYVKRSERICRALAEIWVDLIVRREGGLSPEAVKFIMTRVEQCATGAAKNSAEELGEGSQEQLKKDIQGVVPAIRRDLEIQRREHQLLSASRGELLAGERDDLLPLFRRKVFDSDLMRFVDAALNNDRPLGLLMLDLDHFKQVNDKYGHQVGDEVLLGCATLIGEHLEGKGKAYRYGGEEIAILLPNFSVLESIAVAETLRRVVENTVLGSKRLKAAVSVGVACLPEHANDAEHLLARADEALYRGKGDGGNVVRSSGDPDVQVFSKAFERSVGKKNPKAAAPVQG
jgi:diguanylate cyclase (GGDEF)-like protein